MRAYRNESINGLSSYLPPVMFKVDVIGATWIFFFYWREKGTDQVRSDLCRPLFCKLNESLKNMSTLDCHKIIAVVAYSK